FSEYASSGPETGAIEAVFRDRTAVEVLLNTLFAAQPARLLGVQRTRSDQGGRERFRATGEDFEFDARRSAGAAEMLESRVFRLTFIGRTETVRMLLHGLSDSELAFAV